ncbi:unnamed protein product [Pylaiella littoralis]
MHCRAAVLLSQLPTVHKALTTTAVFALLFLLAFMLTIGRIGGIPMVANALVIVFLHITFTLGEAFLHPVSCPTSARSGALGGAAGNPASPSLTKQPAPPALSVPVFSLATANEDGSTNMNIVTYASPAGIEPERLWMVSLYKSTLSHENFVREGSGVLQILRLKHAPLVPILGQSGGRETNKASRCAGESFPWDQPSCGMLSVPQSVSIIPDCASYITLHMVSKQSAGDHDAVICRVGSVAGPGEVQQDASALSEMKTLETRHLREAGII